MAETFRGKVAVVTGAASGIGYGLAAHAAKLGMRVVMADVEEGQLAESADVLRATGAEVHHIVTDVSSESSVVALAARTEELVGPAYLVINNAGVNSPGLTWELSLAEWEWILGVNLWGVIHGIRAFVPGMVARDDGYLVNVSSMGGLLIVPKIAPYSGSKHAVIAITETIWRELTALGSNVGVSVVCPGFVSTRLLDSKRNWLPRLGPVPGGIKPGATSTPTAPGAPAAPQRLSGMEPAAAAEIIFDKIALRQFWILTHPDEYESAIHDRFDRVARGADPMLFSFS